MKFFYRLFPPYVRRPSHAEVCMRRFGERCDC